MINSNFFKFFECFTRRLFGLMQVIVVGAVLGGFRILSWGQKFNLECSKDNLYDYFNFLMFKGKKNLTVMQAFFYIQNSSYTIVSKKMFQESLKLIKK